MLVDPKWQRRLDDIEADTQLRADLSAMGAYVRRYGWVQGWMGCDREPRCMDGLIYSVTGRWYPGHMQERVDPIIAALGFKGEAEMVDWSEAPGRRKEQVLARIDAALASAQREPMSADAP